MKQFWFYISALILISCAEKSKSTIKNIDENNELIIAYVNSWQDNWGPDFEKANKITHINYAFANIKDGKVVLGHEGDIEVLKKLIHLKNYNPNLKILISVGGWGWSGNFSDAVLTEESREVFANSAISFMQTHRIDGIDLDWEYPGLPGAGNTFREEDRENFTLVLKLIREKLDALAGPDEHFLLTIATGASQRYLDHTNMKEAHKYLDFINIMTYDFHGGGDRKTGHHSNLAPSENDTHSRKRSVTMAVEEHLNAGIPANKLVLGVPFYGRWWKGVHPQNNGIFQPTFGATGAYNYKNIADSIQANVGFDVHWDESGKAPFIYRKSDSLFITYENPKSLQLKLNYLKNKQLAGVMFWQFNGDNGDLLNTIHQEFNKE